MSKSTAVIFVLLSTVSCGKESEEQKIRRMKEDFNSFDVSRSLFFKTNFQLHDFNQEQEDKILAAAAMIEKVIVSDEFKQRVLEHKFNGKKAFAYNDGLSNQQIYKKILGGSERLKPGRDYEMDLVLESYLDEDGLTVGYTYPRSPKVWVNLKYLNRYTPAEVTSNLTHEWLHKLGFSHPSAHTADRRHSVPYAVGYLMKELAQELEER